MNGVRLLRTLGYTQVGKFHLHEGHAALLTWAFFGQALQRTLDRHTVVNGSLPDVKCCHAVSIV